MTNSTMADYSPNISQVPTKSSSSKLILIVSVVILLAVIGIGFLVVRSKSGSTTDTSSPLPSQIIFDEEPSPTPTPAGEAVKKEDLKVNVLNGTGIAREAAFLQKILIDDLKFTDVDSGNADKDTYKITMVAFSDKVSSEIKDELVAKLKDVYDDVDQSKEAPSEKYDIEIITGTRPGVTKSSPKATVKASPVEDEEEESSPTPTPSASASPAT